MAVPARKVSKTRGRTHRAHMALTAKATTKCPKCGAVIRSHRACKECGYYKNVDVLNSTKEEQVKEVKKETPKKETKKAEKKETKKVEKKEVKKETKKAKSKKEEK